MAVAGLFEELFFRVILLSVLLFIRRVCQSTPQLDSTTTNHPSRKRLSFRGVEDLLAERGITVTYESIRLWCIKFGLKYVRRLKKKHQGYGDTFFIDEVFVKIDGKQ